MPNYATELEDLVDDTSSDDENVYLSGNLERDLLAAICADLDFARLARPLVAELAAWGTGPDEDGSQYDALVTIAMKLAALSTPGDAKANPPKLLNEPDAYRVRLERGGFDEYRYLEFTRHGLRPTLKNGHGVELPLSEVFEERTQDFLWELADAWERSPVETHESQVAGAVDIWLDADKDTDPKQWRRG